MRAIRLSLHLSALSIVLAVVIAVAWSVQPAPAVGQVAAAYAFSEGTGTTTADFSGYSQTGTLLGGVDWSTAGRYGGALTFDGVDDVVSVADSNTLDLSATFTLSAWVHPTAAAPSGTIVRKGGTSGDPYAIGLTAAGFPYVIVTTSAGATTFTGDEPVFANQWTHLSAAYTGSVVRLYVNGIKEWAWNHSGAVVTSTGALEIGSGFQGRIDEVRVDALALDVATVRDDMNSPVDPATPLTVGTHTPASGARGVLVTPITARFTRTIDALTLNSNTFELRRGGVTVETTLGYDSTTRTATLTPTSALLPLTDYSVTVLGGPDGVKDPSGGELDATVVWSFQTGSSANVVRLAYGFVEGAGVSVEDASGNGNTGTLMNGTSWTTAGKYGRAVMFDGVNDTLRVSDADTQDATGALTLEAWVYPTALSGTRKIIQKQNFEPEHSYWLGLANNGSPYARVRTDTGSYAVVESTTIAANEWTHLAMTYDGTAIRVFVNGVEAESASASGQVLVSHKPLWIGSGFNTDYFQGRIDDVRMYAKALSASEIVDDMNTSIEDITGPSITVTSPLPDAVDVAVDVNVTATFSEPLAASSVSSSTFELRDASANLVTASVSYDAPTRTATLDPTATLAAGATYTATLKGGGATAPHITDVVGNPLATGYSWSFTTSAATGGPTLTEVSIFPRSMSLSLGGSHQFTATGHYSNGTTSDLSSVATWQSAATGIATVNTTGRITAVAAGDSVITVAHQGFSAQAPITVYEGEAIPPDPVKVATPLDETAVTRTGEATAFLYSGENPIQRGVTPGTIDARRAAVIRGRVLTQDETSTELLPLVGARVTIKDHPEFGHTLTRLDGWYDMAVNGGGSLTVRIERNGYLPADRVVHVPWEDYAIASDAALVALDANVTTIDLTAAIPIQVARGSESDDDDGVRRATVLFPQGTTASLVMPDGSTQPLTTLHVRATEYTDGPNGRVAMPAPLPLTSAYTYAVELSADEALAAGAASITFSAPVPLYVENFLNFPVGGIVPSGYYDRQQGAWIAGENGRIIKLLDVDASGFAEIDINGDGAADAPGELSALGITPAERLTVAELYATGQSLWRVPIPHFTPWDHNWPYGLDNDARRPNFDPARDDRVLDTRDTTCASGSIVECQNQVLGERVPVTGTPFTLTYQSDRADGHAAGRRFRATLSGSIVPASVKRIEMTVRVAGRETKVEYPATAGQTASFAWDGLDPYERPIPSAMAEVAVTHVYGVVYVGPGNFERSFAAVGGGAVIGSRPRAEVELSQTSHIALGHKPAMLAPIGGWALDVHHQFNPADQVLYEGNGTRRSTRAGTRVVHAVAGGGTEPVETAGLATNATLSAPHPVGVAGDGTLWIREGNRMLAVFPAGAISVMGELDTTFFVTGGFALDRQGVLHYTTLESPGANPARLRLHRLNANGTSTVGATINLPSFDEAESQFARLAAAPDGSFYVASNRTIIRIGQGGGYQIIAELPGELGSGVRQLTIAPTGEIYVARLESNGGVIERLLPAGGVERVAGGGPFFFRDVDGQPSTDASLGEVTGLGVLPNGSLVVVDGIYFGLLRTFIRQIDTDGIISTIGGDGTGLGANGEPALGSFREVRHLVVGPDKALYTAHTQSGRVFRLAKQYRSSPDADIRIPSVDGLEVFEFTSGGRHLRTFNALTGALAYSFEYDSKGRLTSVVNGDGLETTIERNGRIPTAIVAPYGQHTALTVNAQGFLSSATAPGNRTWTFATTTAGLLTGLTDPEDNSYVFAYDDDGRLRRDEDAAEGFQTLARSQLSRGWQTSRTTALNRATTYVTEDLATGDTRVTVTNADGTSSTRVRSANFDEHLVAADGTTTEISIGSDPRFGVDASFIGRVTLTMPDGLTFEASTTRTATLADPLDALTLQTQTENTTINGRAYERVFNAATRTVTTRTPEGRTSTSTLDNQGRITSMRTGNLEPVSFTYNSQGQLTTITQDSRQSTIGYDPAGRPSTLTAFTNPGTLITTLGYDTADRLTTLTQPDLRTIHFGYDSNSNVTAVTPPGRLEHAFGYTPVDLTASYTPPEVTTISGNRETTYTFNEDRQPLTIAPPQSVPTTFAYGGTDGRLNTVTFSRGPLQFEYDPTGRVSTLSDPDGVNLAFTYNGTLPLSETWSGGVVGSVSRTFNADLDVATERVNGAHDVAFSYDADRLVTQAGALTITRREHDDLVDTTTLDRTREVFSYDQFGEMTSRSAQFDMQDRFTVEYVRDALGRISQLTEKLEGSPQAYGYVYDDAGRLARVTQGSTTIESFTYDANGNRTHENVDPLLNPPTAEYDEQDRLVRYGAATYTYTANGRLLTKTVGTQVTTYSYDSLGNLIRVVLPNGDDITYTVDGRSRRVAKSINGVRVKGWLYADQLRPIAELDGSGNVVSRFVYGTRPNVPEYIARAGVTYRIFSDHLGSPRVVLNVAADEVVQRLDFTTFGEVKQDSNPGWQPFGFAGGLYDPDVELLRFGARDYDPATGRWTSKDPLRFGAGDTNLYAYIGSDPINAVDPSGLCSFAQNFRFSRNAANDFFFDGYTRLARTALGMLTGGAVARSTGLTTIGMAWRDLAAGQGVANLGVRGTLISIAANSAVNTALSAAALETGIWVGAALDAAAQTYILNPCKKQECHP